MKVIVPSPLLSYTSAREVEGQGSTLWALLSDLDRRYPGFRFRVIDEQDRVRPHMRLFVGQERVRDIRAGIRDGDELMIFGALSGG